MPAINYSMAYNRPPFQSIVGDDEYQQHMTQGYPNSTPSQWGSSSQHLPSWHSGTELDASWPFLTASYQNLAMQDRILELEPDIHRLPILKLNLDRRFIQ